MILLGVSVIIPNSSLFTSLDFFISRFPSYEPSFVIPFTFNGSLFLTMFAGIVLKCNKSQTVQIIIGIIGLILCLIAIPLVTQELSEKTGWYVANGCIILMGMFSSMMQNGVFGLTGMFPGRYISGVMIGISLSGLMFCVFRVILILSLPIDEDKGKDDENAYYGCIIFFALAALFAGAAIVAILLLVKTEFAMYYINRAERGSLSTVYGNLDINPNDFSFVTDNGSSEPINTSSDMNKSEATGTNNSNSGVLEAYKNLGTIPFQMSF